MERVIENHAGGISILAFVTAVAISIGYYQFVYLPQADAKPILPAAVISPPETIEISMAEGSSLEFNEDFFVRKDVRAVLGINNRVVWTNDDSTPHTVTSDEPKYVDKINGPFNSLEQQDSVPGGYVMPGKAFEFTFTAVGRYSYHCEPHPWMQGKIEVVENFS